MKLMSFLSSGAGLLLMTVAAQASPMVYGNIGTPASYTPIVATQTGMLQGTFFGSNAGGEDMVRLYDETSNTYYGYVLDNRTSTIGQVFSFGQVTAGDVLSFEIWNSDDQRRVPGLVDSSDPSLSQDGVTHAFVSSDSNYTYLSMEDLSFYDNGYTDYDYNDLVFGLNMAQVLTPVAATPEPGSLALLGTGLLGGVAAIRRRVRR